MRAGPATGRAARRLAAALLCAGMLALVTLLSTAVDQVAPATARAAPAPAGPRLRLRIDDMTPRVVTADGPTALTVTGELTNIGDAPATGLKVRPQRGDRLRTEGELRNALSGDAGADFELGPFTDLTDALSPGGRLPVRLSVPLRGPENSTLALRRTGVYPLLISVSGESTFGQRTRLTAVRVLLPVLGLPAVPAAVTPSGAPRGAAEAAVVPTPPSDPADSNPVTMLYPLADRPHRLPTGPNEPVVLASDARGGDELAEELADGGRLDGLLDALESAAPPGSAVRDALCVAVDPDLLRTVADIRGGYRLRAPDGSQSEGRGADAATKWLTRLRADTAGRCVVAIPYADADLVALSRAGLPDLVGYATRDGIRIVERLLGTPVRSDVTWPADDVLDERSLTDLLGAGIRYPVLSSDAVAPSGRTSRDSATGAATGAVRLSVPRGRGPGPIGVLADPLVTLAAGDPSSAGESADQVGTSGGRGLGSLSLSSSVSLAGTGTPLSGQDLTGAVVFRALDTAFAGAPVLVAPPHRWSTTGLDAQELLGAVTRLIASGRFRVAPLVGGPAVGDPTDRATTASLVYSLRAGAREVPSAVTSKLKADRDGVAELRSAAYAEQGVGDTPAQVFDPVTEGLLRAASAVSRGRESESLAATQVITDRVRHLRTLVRVLEPPSPFALGDRAAPLPITLANGLPVGMTVRVALSRTPGLRTEPIPPQRIPPLGRLQLRVAGQLSRSGQFSVEARVTTLDGAQLGPVSRLQLRSTAYGTITLWLTGIAGALLVILVARRISRRVRAVRSRPTGPRRPLAAPGARASWADRERIPPVERTLGPMPPLEPAMEPPPSTGASARNRARPPSPKGAPRHAAPSPPTPRQPSRRPPPPPEPGRRPSGTRGR